MWLHFYLLTSLSHIHINHQHFRLISPDIFCQWVPHIPFQVKFKWICWFPIGYSRSLNDAWPSKPSLVSLKIHFTYHISTLGHKRKSIMTSSESGLFRNQPNCFESRKNKGTGFLHALNVLLSDNAFNGRWLCNMVESAPLSIPVVQ